MLGNRRTFCKKSIRILNPFVRFIVSIVTFKRKAYFWGSLRAGSVPISRIFGFCDHVLSHIFMAHTQSPCDAKQHLRRPYCLINQGNPPAQYWKFQCTLRWRSAFPTCGCDATRFQVFVKGANFPTLCRRSPRYTHALAYKCRCICLEMYISFFYRTFFKRFKTSSLKQY